MELHVETLHPSLSVDGDLCRRVLRRVVEGEGGAVDQLTVVFAGHDTVRALNRDYLDHDVETDVLAFDYSGGEGSTLDGEVYVDLDTAVERHHEFGATFTEEALRYAIHGLLHLLGYRDKDPSEKAEMSRLEDLYLKEIRRDE